MVQKEGWTTLDDYIEMLLRLGKRSQDPEFKTLMDLFGKDRVVKIAKQILARIGGNDDR